MYVFSSILENWCHQKYAEFAINILQSMILMQIAAIGR